MGRNPPELGHEYKGLGDIWVLFEYDDGVWWTLGVYGSYELAIAARSDSIAGDTDIVRYET